MPASRRLVVSPPLFSGPAPRHLRTTARPAPGQHPTVTAPPPPPVPPATLALNTCATREAVKTHVIKLQRRRRR